MKWKIVTPVYFAPTYLLFTYVTISAKDPWKNEESKIQTRRKREFFNQTVNRRVITLQAKMLKDALGLVGALYG